MTLPRPDTRILLVLWALIVVALLPVRELMPPDEPRFALVAREMLEPPSGGADGVGRWIVPRLCGRVYPDKPPVLFWLINLFSWPAGGVSATAARVPSALASLAVLLLTVRLGRRLFGPGAIGPAAAGVLLTGSEFFQKAQWVSTDMILTALTLAAATAWSEAIFGRGGSEDAGNERSASPRRAALLACGWIAAGLATLTKGPLGLVWPVAWTGAEALARRRAGSLKALLHPAGPLLFAALVGTWLTLAEAISGGGFVREVVLRQTVTRYLDAWNNIEPWHFYATQLPLDLAPWSFFLPAAVLLLASGRGGVDAACRAGLRACALFLLFAVVFFSLSSGKRGVYLLPAFPAASVWISRAFLAHRPRGVAMLTNAGLCVTALIGLVAAVALPALSGLAEPSIGPVTLGRTALAVLTAGFLALSAGAAGGLVLSRRGRPGASMALCLAGLVLFWLAAGTFGASVASGHQNAAAFGRRMAASVPPGAPVAVERGKFEVILFYMDRPGFPFERIEDLSAAFVAGDAEYAVIEEATLAAVRSGTLPARPVLEHGRISTTRYVLLGPLRKPPDDPRGRPGEAGR